MNTVKNMKVVILGGAGTVGSWTAKTLVISRFFDEIVLGDIDIEKAKKLADEFGENTSYVKVDTEKPETLKEAVKDADVVVNCIGPFYKYGLKVLEIIIDAKKNYVDICDDYDATVKMLNLDKKAKEAGVSAMIGMGSSPGATNLFTKYCASSLLDEVESIDIYHAHGGEPYEGPGVIKHRIHSMLLDIPIFIGGEFSTVKFFEKSGKALIEEIEFPGLGTFKVYPYPHPETITLPRYIKGVKWVMNRGVVLPDEYYELIIDVVRTGMTGEEPLEVGDCRIAPIDFAVAYIIKKREELLEKTGIAEPIGGLKVVVKGKEKGKEVQYVVNATSKGGMMEGTAVPAAIGAILMATERTRMPKIRMKGVFPPEAAVNPIDAFEWAAKFSERGGGIGIKVKKIDDEGNVEEIPLPI